MEQEWEWVEDDQNVDQDWEWVDDDDDAPPERTILGSIGDAGVSAAKGIVSAGETAVGLAGVPTFGLVGKGLEKLGYDPKATHKILDSAYSDAQQHANKEVEEAEGFVDTAGEMVTNPSTIVHGIIQNLPNMLSAGGVSRAILKKGGEAMLKSTMKKFLALGAGSATVSTGAAHEQIRQDNDDGLVSIKQTGQALAAGVTTGALEIIGGRIAHRFGFADLDNMFAGIPGGKGAAMNRVASVFAGSVGEGLNEMPQEAQESMWINAATGKPLMEGVAKAAAQGGVIGAASGGATNIIAPSKSKTDKDKDEIPPPDETPPPLPGDGDPSPSLDSAFKVEDDATSFNTGGSKEDLLKAKQKEGIDESIRRAKTELQQRQQREQETAKAEAQNESQKQQIQAEQTQQYNRQVADNQQIQDILDVTEPLDGALTLTSNLLHAMEQNKVKSPFIKVARKTHQALALNESHDNYQALEKIQYELQDLSFNTTDPIEKTVLGRLDMHLTDRIVKAKKAYEADIPKGKRQGDILPSETDDRTVGRGLFRFGDPKTEQAQDQTQSVIKSEPLPVRDLPTSPTSVTVPTNPNAEMAANEQVRGEQTHQNIITRKSGEYKQVQDQQRSKQIDSITKNFIGQLPKRDQPVAKRILESDAGLGLIKELYGDAGVDLEKSDANPRAVEYKPRRPEPKPHTTVKPPKTTDPVGLGLIKQEPEQAVEVKQSVAPVVSDVRSGQPAPVGSGRVAPTRTTIVKKPTGPDVPVEATKTPDPTPTIPQKVIKRKAKKTVAPEPVKTSAPKSSGLRKLIDKRAEDKPVHTGPVDWNKFKKLVGMPAPKDEHHMSQRWGDSAVTAKDTSLEINPDHVAGVHSSKDSGTQFVRDVSGVADAAGKTITISKPPGDVKTRMDRNRAKSFFERQGFVKSKQDGVWMERAPQNPKDKKKNYIREKVVRFSVKKDYKPKKTIKAYKLFRTLKNQAGKLFPLFIGKSIPTPINEWVVAEFLPTKGYAERPGWHSGILPIAPHLRNKLNKIQPTRVWAEVEIPADVDYQAEADASPTKDIQGHIPDNGYYKFKTNKMQGGAWTISGAVKINRILSDAEVASILEKEGYPQEEINAEMHDKQKVFEHFPDVKFSFAGKNAASPEMLTALAKAKEVADLPVISMQPDVIKEIVKMTNDPDIGGSTFSAFGQNLGGTPYYALSIFPGFGHVIDGKLTEEVMQKYMSKYGALTVTYPMLNFGTWYDKSSGKTFLDISLRVPKKLKDVAVKYAQKYDQKAIFDLETFEELDTGGTGKVTADTMLVSEKLDEIMAEIGEDDSARRQVWDETGWWEMVPGQWSFEINNKDATLVDNAREILEGAGAWGVPLSKVMSSDSLFKAYPHMKNIVVIADQRIGAAYIHEDRQVGGPVIKIDPDILANGYKDRSGVSIMLHELQHSIQRVEGYGRGGSSQSFDIYKTNVAIDGMTDVPPMLKKMVLERLNEDVDLKLIPYIDQTMVRFSEREVREMRSELTKTIEVLTSHIEKNPSSEWTPKRIAQRELLLKDRDALGTEFVVSVNNTPYAKYQKLVGEVQSRLVEKRSTMSDSQLMDEAPWVTLRKMLESERLLEKGQDIGDIFTDPAKEQDDWAAVEKKLSKKSLLKNLKLFGTIVDASQQKVVEALTDVQRMASKAAKVVMVADQEMLPDDVKNAIENDGVVEAAWNPGDDTVYFVLNNISDSKRAVELWMHEQVGHRGLMALFEDQGADFQDFLDFAYKTIKKSKVFAEVAALYNDPTLSEQDQKRKIVEEVIAKRAEKLNPIARKNVFKKFLSFINKWLKNITGYKESNIGFTMADLDMLLETAKIKIMNDTTRNWMETVRPHEEYEGWCKEVWEKNPRAVTWYENHVELVDKTFGKDAQLFSIMLGITSPQAAVPLNTQFAIDTYLYLAGKAEEVGGRYPSNVKKVLDRVLSGELNFSKQYKVDEFVRALTGDTRATVNDLWMHRAFFGPALLTESKVEAIFSTTQRAVRMEKQMKEGKLPKKTKIPARLTLKDYDPIFSISENVESRHLMFQIADKLTKETGRTWHPREVQAAIWMRINSKETGRPIEDFKYDYYTSLMDHRSPKPKGKKAEQKHDGLTPLEYLYSKLDKSEVGQLHKKFGLPEKLYEPMSKLELKYQEYMKKQIPSETTPKKPSGPGGKKSSVAQSPEFKKWFGDSKVVDKNGKPMVLSHGTNNKNFNTFDRKFVTGQLGFHFGTEQQAKNIYGEDTPPKKIIKAYVSIKNPLRMKDPGAWTTSVAIDAINKAAGLKIPKLAPDTYIVEKLQEAGYDGIVYENEFEDSGDSFIAFEPNQIKSATDNTGDFSSENPDIRFSKETNFKPVDINSQGFKDWFKDSKAVDKNNKPMVVYRGEHGETTDGQFHTRLGSLSFGSANAATIYATSPNVKTDKKVAPRIIPAYLSIKNPIINDDQDPYIEFSTIINALGQKKAIEIAKEFSDHIVNTNNWEEISEETDVISVDEFVEKYPERLNELYLNIYPLLDSNKIVKWFKDAGYDGAIYGGTGSTAFETEYRVFSNTQIKSSISNTGKFSTTNPDIRFSKKFKHLQLRDSKDGIMDHARHYVDQTRIWAKKAFTADAIQEAIFDDLHRVKNYSRSAWQSLRMTRSLGTIIGTMMREGTITYDATTNHIKLGDRDGGIMKVFEGMDAEMFSDVKARLLAERVDGLLKSATLDQKILDRIYGDDATGAVIDPVTYTKEVLDQTKHLATDPKYAEVKKHLDKYNTSMMDLLEKSGIISAEKKKEWGSYATYVPLNRILSEDQDPDVHSSPIFADSTHVSGPKAFKGSAGYQIGDPIDNLLLNYTYLINQATRNVAYKKLYNDALPTGMLVHEKIPRSLYLKRKDREHFIGIKVKGKEQYIRVDDPLLYDALAEMDSSVFTLKALNMAKRALTWGVTIAPAFRIRNFIRDTGHTWILMGKVNPLDVAKAFKDVMTNHIDLVELRAMGGAFTGGYYNADNPTSIAKVVDSKRKGDNKRGAAWRAWEKVGEASENANRLALFRKMKLEGKDDFEAAFEAKDLLDFQAHGKNKMVRFMISMVPFLNARLQGLHKMGRQATDDGGRKVILRGAAVALASIALHALNKAGQPEDDPWYDKLSEFDRWSFWHFGPNIAIPKPFELGAIFGELPVQLVDATYRGMVKGDKDALDDLWAFTGHTLLETFNLNPIGQAKVGVEVLTNHDFFRNRPVVPVHMQKINPELQWDHTTSKTARELGKVIGFSPKKIDHIVDGTLSYAGQGALAILDTVIAPWKQYPDDPALTVDSFYWLHGRIPRGKQMYIRQETEFYELCAEVDRVAASLNKIEKIDRKDAKEFAKENKKTLRLKKGTDQIREDLTALREVEHKVYMDTELTPQQKRQELNELVDRRHKIILKNLDRLKGRQAE